MKKLTCNTKPESAEKKNDYSINDNIYRLNMASAQQVIKGCSSLSKKTKE